MRLGQRAALVLLIALLLVSCTPTAVPKPMATPPATNPTAAPTTKVTAAPSEPAKPAWQKEWDATLHAARAEGTVLIATSTGASGRTALAKGFEDATGIKLEGVAGSIGALSSKILAERRAGLYLWDVAVGGSGSQLTILKAGGGMGATESLLFLPDLTDAAAIKDVWYGGNLPWVDRDHKLFAALLFPSIQISINTNLVKPGEVKSWEDLLNPKWKGKILFMDPTIPGNFANDTMPMLYTVKGADWVRKLAAQGAVIISDDRLGVDWLAHEKYPVYVRPREETFLIYHEAGAPVAAIAPEDGNIVGAAGSSVSLIDRQPHPNAAKLFINWYLSKDGQTVISRAYGGQSARNDVPTDFLREGATRKPGAKYWLKEQEDILLKINDFSKMSKEIFAAFLK